MVETITSLPPLHIMRNEIKKLYTNQSKGLIFEILEVLETKSGTRIISTPNFDNFSTLPSEQIIADNKSSFLSPSIKFKE